jgi:hypothetical protein
MKRKAGKEYVIIEIEYVDRKDYTKITYNKNERLLLIINLAKAQINVSALPKDVPERGVLAKVLEALPPIYGSTTVLKAFYEIDGSGDLNVIDLSKFKPFQIDQKGYLVEDVPDTVLVNVLLPMLTYKDVQSLEQFSQARKLIFDYDIWEKLFARDFPEIYHPDMFSDTVVNQKPPPWYIQLLNKISKPGGRLGIEDGFRPYWKLLYEYLLSNKFESGQITNLNTTFYKHKTLTIDIEGQKLIFGSFFLGSPDGQTLLDTPLVTLIKNIDGSILFLEMNSSYIFVIVRAPRQNWVALLSDMNGNIIFRHNRRREEGKEVLTEIMGLIGENGYFYTNEDSAETVIVYNQFKKTYKDWERIIVSYNTRSECFLMHAEDKKTGELVYQLYEIRNNEPEPVLIHTADRSFTTDDHYLTFNHKWIVSCYKLDRNDEMTDNYINVEKVNGEMIDDFIELEANIVDMCIVGDYLYAFGGGVIKVYNLSKITNDQNYDDSKQYGSYDDANFGVVRMSVMGPVFFGYINRDRKTFLMSGLLYSSSITLVSSSICTQCGSSFARYLCGNRCGAQYCNTQCQTRDWKNTHSLICARGGGNGRRQRKIHKVMTEFKEGRLKTSAGKTVTDRKQALAIALSEANELK